MKAYYDERPSVFSEVGNGSVLYRFNICQIEGDETTTNSWECEEVTIWKPFDRKKVVKSVIAEHWDSTHEQKLVNEYNSVVLGIIDSEEATMATEAYMSFLEERKALKVSIESDCNDAGIS